MTLLLAMMSFLSHSQTIRYVKQNGAGDGTSWDNASSDLQGMINASGTAEVWVAKGTYKPGTSRYASFSMKVGVKIYGSFAGTETNLSERTAAVMAANKSILSGDLNGDDVITGSGATLSITNNGENCYHVFYNVYDGSNRLTTDNSLLDGFTITGGNADDYGGGMYNQSSSPNLTNITFSGNNASNGGGLFNLSSYPSLSNSTFEKNQANKGGGINGTSSSFVLNNVLFKGNKASAGGGIYNFASYAPTLTNVIFKENKADGDGGGICNDNASITLNNVYFIDNQASYGGGMYGVNSYGNRINVVFLGNIASVNGGGVYNTGSSYPLFKHVTFIGNRAVNGAGIFNANQTGPIKIINGVFWGNTSSETGPDIKHQSGSISLSYCLLQLESSNYSSGFTLGDGIRYAQNPLFVNAADPDGADNVFGTSDDGLQLSPCSPVINAGTNADAASTDIIGNPRSFGGTVDMGAYESQSPPLTGTRLYVNAAAVANGDGSSWATAYTDLQTALTNARVCSQITEIWVAAGTYYPTTTPTDKTASFVMKNGLAIYGGFAGTEMALSERILAPLSGAGGASILSGDIDHATDPLVVTSSGGTVSISGNKGNSYHVIFNDNNGLNSTAVLDGFTITGGYAFVASSVPNSAGAGIYNNSSSPSLVNCSFSGNEANRGAGMYNTSSLPSLSNCSFSGNVASNGGGMYNTSSSPSLSNCSFSGNEASIGGGMYNTSSSPSLMNCSFSGNRSSLGGGMVNIESSSPSLTNCSFTENYGEREGGGMHNQSSSVSLTNCSFSKNKTNRFFGGGMYNSGTSLNLINCSFLGNQAISGAGGAMFNLSLLSSTITNCIFLGNQSESGGGAVFNWSCSPSFVNCTLSGNSASSGNGGGMLNYVSSSPSIKNCILWGNSDEVANLDNDSNPTYTKTLVKGMALGGFQGNENPLFVSQPSVELGITGDLRLQACSPVLNAGNNADNSTTVDLGNNNRKVGAIDLGAYEYQSAPPAAATPTVNVSHPTTCGGTEGNIRLSGFLNNTTYSVTYKKNNVSVSAANFTSDGSGVLTFTGLGAGSYTDMVATYGACVSNAATATLTDPTKPTATIAGTVAVCQSSASPSITFTGQSGTGAYTFTYKLNEGTSQTATTTSGSSVTVPVTTGTAGEFTYRLVSVANSNNCNQTQTGSAVVTVNPLPTATISGKTTVCQNSASPSITFTGANATAPYTFTYKINDGVAQTVKTVSGNSVTVPVSTTTAGTFTYALVSVTESSSTTCSQEQTGSAVVTVNPLPTATISGTTTVCQNSPSTNITFTGANATAPYTFTYKINDGSLQTVTTTSGNGVTVEAPTGVSGSFVYTLISVLESSSTACSQTQSGSAAVTVNPLPTASISGTTTVCQNSPSPNITFTGANATAPYTFTYKIKDGAAQTVKTSSGNSVTVPVSTTAAGTFTYTLVSVSESSSTSCSQVQTGSATVTVNPLPTATISGTTTICQNSASPSITFTGANAMAPYTFTYKINDGAAQMVKTSSGNSVTVPVSTTAAGTFTYTLVSVSESSSTTCSQEQVGSVVVKVQGKPTITLSTLQQTLNEGNNQTLCDTDANPVNSLQFTVSGSCVVGSPVWRVQVGSGAWSEWFPNPPVTQFSNNQPYRYQAACDASCSVTYTSPITIQINYRSSTPQQVSLVADGVTVKEGESKEVCNIEGNVLIFNATCASGEVLLYSVDGGDYSSVVSTQLVDGQFHNYRVRCRKSDGTLSCIESESGVMRLKITNGLGQVPVASLNVTSGCGTPVSFSGTASCGSLTTVWYNASTNVALATLPSQTPTETTSYYARCQAGGGCLSEKSNVVTYTVIPVGVAPVVSVSSEVVCAGTSVTISANCPSGSQTLWSTGVTASSFEVSFNNVTKQTYWAKCVFSGGCQSAESVKKEVYWNAFVVTLINVGQSKSAVKSANDKALWSSQFIGKDGGPELAQSTQSNPTLYFVENVNKVAPRYWTMNVDACGLGTDGSLTFDLLATPETGVPQSFNTHENNAPYFMYANRDGWTELYAQNHPAYGFYQDNGAGANAYDAGLPKGLYKLGIRYWDQKGWGSIYPSTRKPQGNVLAYQEYWFRIQSKDGVGIGAARTAEEQVATTLSSADARDLNPNVFAQVMPNPVSNVLRLQVQRSKGQEVNATLLDVAGRKVLSRAFVPETHSHQEEFEVDSLPIGIYLFQVSTTSGQQTLKVVKVP